MFVSFETISMCGEVSLTNVNICSSITGDGHLLEAVRKRKCLWDITSPDYKLTTFKKQMWEEVAVETGRSGKNFVILHGS